MSKREKNIAEFTELIEANKALIAKVASAYCREAEDRKDLMQEIALQMWRSFPNYNPDYALSTWMYRVALNTSISFVRKRINRQKHLDRYSAEVQIFQWQDTRSENRLNRLYDLISHLNTAEKALIILYLEGRPNPEIADIMGLSVTNVSTRLNRIRIKLKELNQTK